MCSQEIRQAASHEKKDILIVEDNLLNLRLVSQILTANGYKVRPVTNGEEALAAVRSKPPDLVLLDVMMPGMNGYEVCQRLKAEEQARDIPVIFLSALSATEDKIKAFTVGGVDYITKPFQAREVVARVATHLALKDLHSQLETANRELEKRNAELNERNRELQEALDTIQNLSGLIPICAWCGRKIEDEEGQWVPLELYIESHSGATFTHGMCPDCFERMRDSAEQVLRSRGRGNR
jgi:PleD family two-component response regulator